MLLLQGISIKKIKVIEAMFQNKFTNYLSFFLASLYKNKETLSLAEDLTLTLHLTCNKTS